MATIGLTSLAWLLLIVGGVALANVDENGTKLALGLWFSTAIALCMYGAFHYSVPA